MNAKDEEHSFQGFKKKKIRMEGKMKDSDNENEICSQKKDYGFYRKDCRILLGIVIFLFLFLICFEKNGDVK